MDKVRGSFLRQRTSRGEDDRHLYCVSDMQGWRISMEDAHAAVLNLPEDVNVPSKERVSFFAVYDGHGGTFLFFSHSGANVARYAGRTVHGRLVELPEFKEHKWESALRRAFLKTDEDLRIGTLPISQQTPCTRTTHRAVPRLLRCSCPSRRRMAAVSTAPTRVIRVACSASLVRPSR